MHEAKASRIIQEAFVLFLVYWCTGFFRESCSVGVATVKH